MFLFRTCPLSIPCPASKETKQTQRGMRRQSRIPLDFISAVRESSFSIEASQRNGITGLLEPNDYDTSNGPGEAQTLISEDVRAYFRHKEGRFQDTTRGGFCCFLTCRGAQSEFTNSGKLLLTPKAEHPRYDCRLRRWVGQCYHES